MSNKTGFRQGRLGIGKEPIFPLDISGSIRIDGDLVLVGNIADERTMRSNPIWKILVQGKQTNKNYPKNNLYILTKMYKLFT